MAFRPNPNDILEIDGIEYSVAEHTAAPGMPYGQEGRAATVYKVVAKEEGERRALKVFKRRYQVPALVSLAHKLEAFAEIPGLEVCKRQVITARRHTQLVRQHPDLAFAVLMPWIEGPTWMEVLFEGRELSPEQSLKLARALVEVLSEMEERGLAHCDLSGPNILLPMFSANYEEGTSAPVELVDVEQLYGPGLDRPEAVPAGSSGYAHQVAASGVWHATGDRFAGALIVAEMLCWCDPRVREAAWGESYFDPEEMQQEGSNRYGLLLGILQERWGEAAARLFEQAWLSDSLQDCPTISAWLTALPDEPPDDIFSGQVVPQVISPPVPRPAPVTMPVPVSIPLPTPVQEVVATTPLAPSITPTAGMTGKVKSLLDDAKAFEKSGNTGKALGSYKEALSLLPPGSSAYNELSLIISRMEQGSREGHEFVSTLPEVPVKGGVSVQDTGVVVKQAVPVDGVQIRRRNSAAFLVPVLLIVALLVFGGIAITMLDSKSGSAGQGEATATVPPAAFVEASATVSNSPNVASATAVEVAAPSEIVTVGADSTATALALEQLQSVASLETAQALDGQKTAEALAVVNATAQAQETSQALVAANQTAQALQTEQARAVTQQTAQTLAIAQKTTQAQIQLPPTPIPPDIGATAEAHANQTVVAQAAATARQATAIVLAQANQTAAAIAKVANQTKTAVAQAAAQATAFAKQTAAAIGAAQKATASAEKTVVAKALPTAAPVQQVASLLRTIKETESINSIAFSPDGKTLASGSDDNTIKLYNVSDGAIVGTFSGHTDVIRSVAFSPDGKTLASGSDDNTIKLWRVADGTLISTLEEFTGQSPVTSVTFSPDGQMLVSTTFNSDMKVWRLSDGIYVHRFSTSSSNAVFSPDGQSLAAASDVNYNETGVWKVLGGTVTWYLKGHTDEVSCVAFSPDGQLLASGSDDKTIIIWRMSDGKLLKTLSGHSSYVSDVAFSPDGATLASGSYDNTVKLWGVLDGKLIGTLSGHLDAVNDVAFSPDGQVLASASADQTIRLWKMK